MGNLCSSPETNSPRKSNKNSGDIVIFPVEDPVPDDNPVSPHPVDGVFRVPQPQNKHSTVLLNEGETPGDIQIEVPELKELNTGAIKQCSPNSESKAACRAEDSAPVPPHRDPSQIENRPPEVSIHRVTSPKERPIRWTKGELIGAGAYGRVYLGLNQETGRLVAVKEVRMPTDESCKARVVEQVQSLEAEVKVLKQFKHPNIVQYLGTERNGDTLNIFLEYAAGGSVASLISKFGSFQETLIRVFTRQILRGLEFLHKNKIAHRDIKGGNILVDHGGMVKLADFGASKKIESLVTMNTGFKSLKGTPYWMAPEVIKQTGHGRQADIWSVGCTVIEMATGKPPWSEVSNNVTVMFHIASAKGPPPIPEWLSVEAQDFLKLCFNRNPKERPNATRLLMHPFVANAGPCADQGQAVVPIDPQKPFTFNLEMAHFEEENGVFSGQDLDADLDGPAEGRCGSQGSDFNPMQEPTVQMTTQNFGRSVCMEEAAKETPKPDPPQSSIPGSESVSHPCLESFVHSVRERAIADTLRLSQPFKAGALASNTEFFTPVNDSSQAAEKEQQWANELEKELEEMKEQQRLALRGDASHR